MYENEQNSYKKERESTFVFHFINLSLYAHFVSACEFISMWISLWMHEFTFVWRERVVGFDL